MRAALQTNELPATVFSWLPTPRPDTPERLRQVRDEALGRFLELGFPTTRLEDWKYTNVSAIAKTPFRAASPAARLPHRPEFLALEGPRLVFVNGWFSPELSHTGSLGPEVRLTRLAVALNQPNTVLHRHLARHASFQGHAFAALNTACFNDGALLEIADGAIISNPVHLVFVSAPDGEPVVTHPRVLVVAGRAAQARIVEEYISIGPGFTNAVTEIIAADGAVIEHYKIERESSDAFHVALTHFHQARDSAVTAHSVSLGGRLVRNDVGVLLDGEGAVCTLNGLYVAGAGRHIDNHTSIDHARSHTNSRQYYKGILDGASTGVFNGKIIVRPPAQKTDAIQSNKNLLLSPDASINTKPQLEIYADDVRCTHGATVGQLEEDAVFYLRSRGLDDARARLMLTHAFAGDVLERMTLETVGRQAEQSLGRLLAPSEEEP